MRRAGVNDFVPFPLPLLSPVTGLPDRQNWSTPDLFLHDGKRRSVELNDLAMPASCRSDRGDGGDGRGLEFGFARIFFSQLEAPLADRGLHSAIPLCEP